MSKRIHAVLVVLMPLAFALPICANAECKTDPAKIFQVGKVYASSDLTRITDENCTGVVYRPDYTKTMVYLGTAYQIQQQKVDDGTGPVAYYKIISIRKL